MKPRERTQNIRRRRRQRERKRKYLTQHHLTPKVRGGRNDDNNLLTLWNDKHELWHMLWGERTVEEVIDLLQRVVRVKGRSNKYPQAA